jgi:hypothetical protein
VPEPATVALLGLGMVALTFTRRKLRKYTKPFLAKKTRNIPGMFRVFLFIIPQLRMIFVRPR